MLRNIITGCSGDPKNHTVPLHDKSKKQHHQDLGLWLSSEGKGHGGGEEEAMVMKTETPAVSTGLAEVWLFLHSF